MSKFLYFIQEEDRGCVKIGVSDNPVFRLKSLQGGNPFPLTIVACARGSRIAERSLHRRFTDCRLEGEWFRSSPDLSDVIASYPTWEEYQNGADLPVADNGMEVLTALYEAGYKMREIGDVLGVSRQAVEQQLRARNIPRRRAARKAMSTPS